MTTVTGVLFVCMGNICRSPTAEAVFRHKARQAGVLDRLLVDSAGTHNYHPGEPPDVRSQHHAQLRGYDLSALRARAMNARDFQRFDWLIVMDDLNYSAVIARADTAHHRKVRRLLEFSASAAAQRVREVPDPYYGEPADFERVLDLVEDAVDGLIAAVVARLR